MSALKPKFAPALVPYAVVGQANGVAALDGTGKLPSAQLPSGIAPFSRTKQTITLAAGDITNGFVNLANKALPFSIHAMVRGGTMLEESLDTGTTGDYVADNSGSVTKFTWKNDLVSGGATPLAAGDVLHLGYAY